MYVPCKPTSLGPRGSRLPWKPRLCRKSHIKLRPRWIRGALTPVCGGPPSSEEGGWTQAEVGVMRRQTLEEAGRSPPGPLGRGLGPADTLSSDPHSSAQPWDAPRGPWGFSEPAPECSLEPVCGQGRGPCVRLTISPGRGDAGRGPPAQPHTHMSAPEAQLCPTHHLWWQGPHFLRCPCPCAF